MILKGPSEVSIAGPEVLQMVLESILRFHKRVRAKVRAYDA